MEDGSESGGISHASNFGKIIEFSIAMGCCLFLIYFLIVSYENVRSEKSVFDEIKGFTGENFWGKKSLQHCDTKSDKIFGGQSTG